MINLILLLSAIPGLVLLYFQWKIKGQQEQFIKAEAESLKKLQFQNQQYTDAGLFGLQPGSSYLQPLAPAPRILTTRRLILTQNAGIIRKNRKLKQFS